MRTPSQTAGPFFRIGLCTEPQNELPSGSVRIEGQLFDGEDAPIADAMLELWSSEHGFGRCPTDGEGRFSFLVPAAPHRFELMVFARGAAYPERHGHRGQGHGDGSVRGAGRRAR